MTNKDEDHGWLDALSGKPNADADPDVTRRATALRQAIQRHDATLGANDFDVEAGLQKLKLKLGKDGLLKPESSSNNFGKRLAAIIASLNEQQAQSLMAKVEELCLAKETKNREQNMDYVTGKKEGLLETKSNFNKFCKRWAAIIASLISAFAFGIAVTRFAMLPAMEGVRSGGDVVEIKNLNSFAQKVPVYVSDPTATAQLAISEALRLRLNITINATPSGYNLWVEGLVSNSPEQNNMKNILGISVSASGNLLFQIQVKAKE